jgi:hypothetical protein
MFSIISSLCSSVQLLGFVTSILVREDHPEGVIRVTNIATRIVNSIENKSPANKAHIGSKSRNFTNIIIDNIPPTRDPINHIPKKVIVP